MQRIRFLIIGILIVAGMIWRPPSADADFSSFTIAILKYRGGNYNPRPQAVRSLLAQLGRRTSIEINREPIEIELTNPKLYQYPFLYMAGNAAFDPFPEKEIRILRHYLNYGGFLLIDDNSAKIHSEFDASVRKMISRVFPKIPLQKIPRDHSIFRSFYLINRVAGRVILNPVLEGITVKGRTVLVYCTNDLGGAWSRDKLGHWNFDVVAGGTRQRQGSIRLGINIIMYALTLDYKKDMVHLPIILERLRRYHTK